MSPAFVLVVWSAALLAGAVLGWFLRDAVRERTPRDGISEAAREIGVYRTLGAPGTNAPPPVVAPRSPETTIAPQSRRPLSRETLQLLAGIAAVVLGGGVLWYSVPAFWRWVNTPEPCMDSVRHLVSTGEDDATSARCPPGAAISTEPAGVGDTLVTCRCARRP